MILKFKQLSGARNVLELADHAAPFGRPRVGPVAEDGIELRESETYCAGSNLPVRHVFGLKLKPWEFHGRFEDSRGGLGFSRAKVAEVKRFVAEMQEVEVTWGESLAAVGLITDFTPGRESERSIPWKMTVKITSDLLMNQVIAVEPAKRPTDYTNQILLASTEVLEAFHDMPLRGSVFDSLNSLISSVASFTAQVAGIADAMRSFEAETIGSLRRFRAAVGQLKTAALIARDAIDAFPVDLAIQARNANEQLSFLSGQASISGSLLALVRQTVDADKAAAHAEQGQIKAIHTATTGETFESISAKYFGTASKASAIRQANGASDGDQPGAGQLYVIPG